MKKYGIILIALSAMAVFSPGCTREQGINKGKFAELIRIVQDLKTAIASGKACDVPNAVLERLAAGTAVLKDKAGSQDERDLLAACEDLAAIYRDGLLLCRSRTHLTGFPFVPKGRIYVTQELDPVVEKYGFSTERHEYKPTGQYWKSIDAGAINTVWEQAGFRIRYIENMVRYH